MSAIQHGQGLVGRNQQRDPAHGLFEQRLALEQRTELLRHAIAENFAGERAEAYAVASSKNHRGVLAIIKMCVGEKARFWISVLISRACSGHLTISHPCSFGRVNKISCAGFQSGK
jgi:hypothetical protein